MHTIHLLAVVAALFSHGAQGAKKAVKKPKQEEPAWKYVDARKADYTTLTGMKPVFRVTIEGFDEIKDTLQVQEMRKVVQSLLHEHGIAVAGPEFNTEQKKVNGQLLYINLNLVTPEETHSQVYAFNLSFAVIEQVSVLREPTHTALSLFAFIWFKDVVGATGKADLRKSVDDSLKTLVNLFCSDYVKANPRK